MSNNSYAEPIMITASGGMNEIIFDGKWTFETEWKKSSLNKIKDNVGFIRSAHQGDYIYIMLDIVADKTIDLKSDRAMICFDTENNKSKIPDENDFCFVATLGSSNPKTLQGGSLMINKSFFKKITNFEGTIAIGNVSDENDRYDKVPHASYEFRIPKDAIKPSDNYGFLVYVYDKNENRVMTWPESIQIDNNRIPSPSTWGNLVSPDKSLPEFPISFLIIIPALLVMIFFTKKYPSLQRN